MGKVDGGYPKISPALGTPTLRGHRHHHDIPRGGTTATVNCQVKALLLEEAQSQDGDLGIRLLGHWSSLQNCASSPDVAAEGLFQLRRMPELDA